MGLEVNNKLHTTGEKLMFGIRRNSTHNLICSEVNVAWEEQKVAETLQQFMLTMSNNKPIHLNSLFARFSPKMINNARG